MWLAARNHAHRTKPNVQRRRHVEVSPGRTSYSTASLLNKPHVIPTLKINIKDYSLFDVPRLLRQRIGAYIHFLPSPNQPHCPITAEVAPSFYSKVPVILDLEGVSSSNPPVTASALSETFAAIRQLNVFPIGICNPSAEVQVSIIYMAFKPF